MDRITKDLAKEKVSGKTYYFESYPSIFTKLETASLVQLLTCSPGVGRSWVEVPSGQTEDYKIFAASHPSTHHLGIEANNN
jgi:hypothetical protein